MTIAVLSRSLLCPLLLPFYRPVWRAVTLLLSMLLSAFVSAQPSMQPPPAARLIVLSDIEADPDDAQTLIRLLLYANEIDIEGLIATTSVHQKDRIAPETMHQIIEAYGAVQPNLTKHAAGYPAAAFLHERVAAGVAAYGMQGLANQPLSDGAKLIIEALEKDDERPLWISVWGGANTLAQALQHLQARVTAKTLAAYISKLRVYTISDQDDSGHWLRSEFANLFYIVSPGGYNAATWTGINTVVEGIDNTTISNAWLSQHIQQDHGPMGALYPDVAYGMEGDTPAWLNLIPNGLSWPEQPAWGGWGGRYTHYQPKLSDIAPDGFTGGVPVLPEPRAIWTNAIDTVYPLNAAEFGRSLVPDTNAIKGFRATLWRWRDAFQHDFAARMDWTIMPYAQANHPPVPGLKHAAQLQVKSGEYFALDARDSSDPDGDSLQYYWFNYAEPGTLPNHPVDIGAANISRVNVKAPAVTSQQTLHFIVAVRDRGTPALTRYARVIVTVMP